MNGIGSQQVLHLCENRRRRAGDLFPPPIVARRHEQDALTQIDVRDARQRRPDRELPREVRLLFRRGLAADNLRDDARREVLDGLHSAAFALRASTFALRAPADKSAAKPTPPDTIIR